MSGNIEDSYAPNLLPYFSPDGELKQDINLSVECGICKTGLAITTPADQDHGKFTMLPCGHLFCHHCVTRWFQQAANCPQCRKKMKHSLCGHKAIVSEMEGGPDFNIHRDLPPVLGAGEGLPGLCARCQSGGNRNNNRNGPSLGNYIQYQPQPPWDEVPWLAPHLRPHHHSDMSVEQTAQYATRNHPSMLPRTRRASPRPAPRPRYNGINPQSRYVGTACYHCYIQMEMNGRRAFFLHPHAARRMV